MSNPTKTPEKGAAATLGRLQEQEVYHWQEMAKWKDKLTLTRTQIESSPDNSNFLQQLANAEREYGFWSDEHRKSATALLAFEKSVTPEQREGTKWPQSSCEAWFESFTRLMRLGTESAIMSISQDALSCSTPEQVYKLGAARIRDCVLQAIETGVRNDKMPMWVKVATEKGMT